jgi:radical SAM protein
MFTCPDFAQAPLLVIWETTRSCALACKHCRASADLFRDPRELSTSEGKALIDGVADMGTPILILSGGDPLNRPDLDQLVVHSKNRGLRVGTIPAATPSLTYERLASLKDAGLDQLAFSLDGPDPLSHDSFRGVRESFRRTIQGASYARRLKLPLQINTCFSSVNLHHLERMIELVTSLGASFWEVFFLIPIGRGQLLKGATPDQMEAVFERLARLEEEGGPIVKITEGQHYRRFLAGRPLRRPVTARPGHGALSVTKAGIRGGVTVTSEAVNAGKGFMFIDRIGDICPSGFLPISAGNVRDRSLSDVYRHSPLFTALRDSSRLKGKCGRCEFSAICSGSRARAYALTGDYLAPDPGCAYQPAALASA